MSTPVNVSEKLDKADENAVLFDVTLYQSAVGSLLYLATKTRPDISFAVSNVARHCSRPTEKHWSAVKRIFRYLCGTKDFGIMYSKQKLFNCIGYSDADFAGDHNDRKSTSGYCFVISGSLVAWRTSKQTCVALSTAESELIALALCCQQSVWLKQLLTDLKTDAGSPMTINEDNQAAISIAKDGCLHSKTKHVSVKSYFIQDLVKKNEIFIEYCPTNFMLADLFTKGLTPEKFRMLRSRIGMISLKEFNSP